ncbi:UNVERIFIED_CONTAM: hypothetical protein GTU68_064425 [Idotea baltica]|nr:hypothetical protein [Idotea baltica]
MANRHGLISGATGTGKTVTLQVLAENFSKLGVPVVTADVKGDLSGVSQAGTPHVKIDERLTKIGLENYSQKRFPVSLWDLYGEKGHPVRTTISEMGPLLLSRLLSLSETQEQILEMAFKFADDEGMLLLDMKDLMALIKWLGDNSKELQSTYGNISSASIGAIQRRLLALEEAGGDKFFGEVAIKLDHLMQKDFSGNGVVSIIDASSLMHDKRLYSTFLLWVLSELFEDLPEVGDAELPKLIFFFDEAHLLFNDAPKVLIEKIETVVRLIRSKGVGVYFVTQSPADVPENVLGQLGNKIQHALRAYTPKDRKSIKAASDSFRPNPLFKTEDAITNLGTGESLVSVLDEDGAPTIVEKVLNSPPESRMGPITPEERKEIVDRSPLQSLYSEVIDRESASEILAKRTEELIKKREEEAKKEEEEKEKKKASKRQSPAEAFFKSIARSIGSQVGRQIIRGVLGSITGKK